MAHQADKEHSFKKYYRIIRRDFIDIELALKATARSKRSTKTVGRGKDGRFVPIPENTDTAIPQNSTSVSENADENNKNELERMNRDRSIDGKQDASGIEKAKPRVDIREYAVKNGFFKAMKLMYGTEGYKKKDDEDFEETMEERIKKAKKFYGRE